MYCNAPVSCKNSSFCLLAALISLLQYFYLREVNVGFAASKFSAARLQEKLPPFLNTSLIPARDAAVSTSLLVRSNADLWRVLHQMFEYFLFPDLNSSFQPAAVCSLYKGYTVLCTISSLLITLPVPQQWSTLLGQSDSLRLGTTSPDGRESGSIYLEASFPKITAAVAAALGDLCVRDDLESEAGPRSACLPQSCPSFNLLLLSARNHALNRRAVGVQKIVGGSSPYATIVTY